MARKMCIAGKIVLLAGKSSLLAWRKNVSGVRKNDSNGRKNDSFGKKQEWVQSVGKAVQLAKNETSMPLCSGTSG